MNKREKILLIAFVSALAGVLVYLTLSRFIWTPARQYAAEAQALRTEGSKLESENHLLALSKGKFARLRDLTFDDNTLRASVLVASRINQLVKQAGLRQNDFKVSPFTRTGSASGFSEVGCTVRGRTSLAKITNLLYVLGQDKHLHRITNLEILPQARRKTLSFSLRYTAPTLDRPPRIAVPRRKPPTTQMAALASLNDPARSSYDVIEKRNIFAPYIRPAVVARVRTPRRVATGRQPVKPAQPKPASFDKLVVAGLPSLNDKPQIHLATPGQVIEKLFKVGDKLPVGRIAMVDYRVLPMPGKPDILTTSRLILKVGKDYWVVELGQQLGQRRLLRSKELPESLKSKPAGTAPTAATKPAAKSPPPSKRG